MLGGSPIETSKSNTLVDKSSRSIFKGVSVVLIRSDRNVFTANILLGESLCLVGGSRLWTNKKLPFIICPRFLEITSPNDEQKYVTSFAEHWKRRRVIEDFDFDCCFLFFLNKNPEFGFVRYSINSPSIFFSSFLSSLREIENIIGKSNVMLSNVEKNAYERENCCVQFKNGQGIFLIV